MKFKLLGYADESWRAVTVIAGINKTMEVHITVEVVTSWQGNYMIQKINSPGVILEGTHIVGTVVPKNTTSSANGYSAVERLISKTLPLLFNGNLLPKEFVNTIAESISHEYEIVPATHEFYDKNNEGFMINTSDDFEDVKTFSWSNINY